MRIAVAQINTNLGDFKQNSEKIIEWTQRAAERHCDLVVFPESTIFGYHPFDLLERKQLVEDQIQKIEWIQKRIPPNVAIIIGAITKNSKNKGRPYFNSALLIEKSKKIKVFHKQLLPTGDVFDEARFIENGSMAKNVFKYKGKKIFLTICEDIWAWKEQDGSSQYLENPIEKLNIKDVDLVVNLSASPFYPGKIAKRKQLVAKTARKFRAPMIYCNLVGAQDEIVFDGASFAMSPRGECLMQSSAFEEELNIFDLSKNEGGIRSNELSEAEEIRRALILGIRDFCSKTGMQKVHLGLSGGVDSALVACLAVDALGFSKVNAIALPTEFNSSLSFDLAKKLAKNLQIELLNIPIQKSFETLRDDINQAYGISEFGVVHENLQARIRGTYLMAYSNLKSSLLLNTSNKSEFAVGYSTLYGDMCGGLSPIGDLTKEQVYALCALYNETAEVIPSQILNRAPTAELRPNQKDQDSLPEYNKLDESVRRIVEQGEKPKTKTDHWLLQRLFQSEFKRWQAPPILKVSRHSFGRGRRWPIAQNSIEN